MIKIKKRKFLMLPGDGIGPEVVGEVKKIINWFNSKKSMDFEMEEGLAGGASYDKYGTPITDEVFYKALVHLTCDPKYGGQGMPKTVSAFFDEMLSSASLAFKLYSQLSLGAYNCINQHATEEIKNKYLPKIVEGKWSGTMCLTEPVRGTDLGLLKTKAVEQGDGTYKISGQKIFITSVDHDLTENIIHLVTARASDSPAGTKGISLFLVPKFIVNENGTVGPRNIYWFY